MIKLRDKICNFVSLYRSPQSEYDFENFCNNFELTLDAVLTTNPFLIVAIGDLATGILVIQLALKALKLRT